MDTTIDPVTTPAVTPAKAPTPAPKVQAQPPKPNINKYLTQAGIPKAPIKAPGEPKPAAAPAKTTTPVTSPKDTATTTEVLTDTAAVRESTEWKAALSAKAKLLEGQRKLQTERQALAKDAEDVKAYKAAMAEAKATNGKSVLKALNMTYEQMALGQFDDGKAPPELEVAALNDKLRQLEADRKAEQQAQIDALKEQESQAVTQAKQQVAKQINTLSEKYPLTVAMNNADFVANAIYQHYVKYNEEVTIDEACAVREAELQASVPSEFKRMASNPAIRALFKAAMDEVEAGEAPTAPVKVAKPRAPKDPAAEPTTKESSSGISKSQFRNKLMNKYFKQSYNQLLDCSFIFIYVGQVQCTN